MHWLGLDGADGYVPWWYADLLLSRYFPAVKPWEWSTTPEARLWANRVWAAFAAERGAKEMKQPTP